MLDWLNLSKESDVWPQRDVIKYIRCSVVMDGLIKRLDPDFDVGAALAKAAHGHLEASVRRNVFSYERVFEALSSGSELVMAGPTALRTAVNNVAKALELPAQP
jgi:predicted unusual protein kinase regulating ubiquinone biosynthesis (AarF/ABC1/UbiB family)